MSTVGMMKGRVMVLDRLDHLFHKVRLCEGEGKGFRLGLGLGVIV